MAQAQPTQRHLEMAYEHGRQAARHVNQINPFRKGTPSWSAWSSGRSDALEDELARLQMEKQP